MFDARIVAAIARGRRRARARRAGWALESAEAGDRRGEGLNAGPPERAAPGAGDPDRALALLGRAEGLLRSVGEPAALADLLSQRGELNLRAGDRSAARAALEESRGLVAAHGGDGDCRERLAALEAALAEES